MIQLAHFTKKFKDKVILNSIDVLFQDGFFYGLRGESGAGKTTLLRLLSLLDDQYEGSLIINGKDRSVLSKKEKEKFRVETFGYVFSDARLLDYLTVRENILLPCYLQKKAIDEERLLSLSKEIGVFSLLSRKEVSSLSEGEKQRVSILRALLLDCPILVCDEPTAHLNEELSKEITSLLSSIVKKEKKLVIRSTHDESLASYFDSVRMIKEGKISERK